MKKLLSILLLSALLLSMAACGAKLSAAPESASAPDTVSSPAQESVPEKKQRSESAKAQRSEAPRETSPEEESAEDEEKLDARDMVGEKNAGSYANKGLAIRAKLPEGWQILDDEQTAQLMGQLAEKTDSESLANILSTAGSMCDMYALSLDGTGDNLNITIEDLGIAYGIVLDEERYLDIGAKNLENTLLSMGITNVQIEKESFFFAGEERFSALLTAEFNGRPMYERMILIKVDRFMGLVTSFSFDEGRINDILGCFEPY